MLNVTIELRNFRGYFEDHLRGVAVGRAYLRTINGDALISLQSDTFKVRLKAKPSIGREDLSATFTKISTAILEVLVGRT